MSQHTTEDAMDEQYYTAEEAMKLLGKTRATFYREVDAGAIPYELPIGKKRGRMFPKEAIDLHAKIVKQEQAPTTFQKSTNAELWTRIQHSRRIYGEDDYVPYARALEWLKRNPDIFMTLKSNDQMVACATIMPIDEDVILELIEDRIRERDIPLDAIQPWTGNNLYAYIPTIAVHPTGNKKADAEYGAAVIRHTVRWAIELQEKYDIKKWYAIGATPEGQRILEFIKFEQIVELSNRKGYALKPDHYKARYIQQLVDKMNSSIK